MAEWIDACATDDIDEEDLIRFDHGDRTFAIYRSPNDEFFCTDGLCTGFVLTNRCTSKMGW